MRRQPILIQSKVDGTWHAFPAAASSIDIEKYFRRYDNGQTLPDFAFGPAYRVARAFNSAQTYQPPEDKDGTSAKTVRVTARRGVITPRPGTRLARSLYLNCLERGEGCNFNVAPNPDASRKAPEHEVANEGRKNIRKYEGAITSVSNEMNMDPNLLRSIMFMETSHGGYGGAGKAADALGISKSVLPMNVNQQFWGRAWGSPEELRTPIGNVRAGARYLKALMNRYPGATTEQIATLYNSYPANKVSDYGARVDEIYNTRPWEMPDDPDRNERVVDAFRHTPLW